MENERNYVERITAAVEKFRRNEHWRQCLDDAPPKAKEHIRLNFWSSAADTDEERNVAVDMMRKCDGQLGADDWKYLYEFARKHRAIGQAVRHYKVQYEAALARENGGAR